MKKQILIYLSLRQIVKHGGNSHRSFLTEGERPGLSVAEDRDHDARRVPGRLIYAQDLVRTIELRPVDLEDDVPGLETELIDDRALFHAPDLEPVDHAPSLDRSQSGGRRGRVQEFPEVSPVMVDDAFRDDAFRVRRRIRRGPRKGRREGGHPGRAGGFRNAQDLDPAGREILEKYVFPDDGLDDRELEDRIARLGEDR